MMADDNQTILAATNLGLQIMWALTIVLVLFVCLRIFVRTFLVRKVGPDDHAFLWAGVIGLVTSVLFQLACNWGFESPVWYAGAYNMPNFSQIMVTAVAAQSLVLVALTLAKISVGLFILNLVLERWQRIFLWVLMGLLVLVCIAAVGITWFECTPVQALWDTTYLHSRTCVNIFPVGVLHGAYGAFYDFSFAIMPWALIWPHTKLSRREKLHSCCCLSLGGVGGLFALGKLYTQVRAQTMTISKHETILSYLVWPVAELLAVIVCVATPAAIRPLFLHTRRRNGNSTNSSRKKSDGRTPDSDHNWMRLDDLPEIDTNLALKTFPV